MLWQFFRLNTWEWFLVGISQQLLTNYNHVQVRLTRQCKMKELLKSQPQENI